MCVRCRALDLLMQIDPDSVSHALFLAIIARWRRSNDPHNDCACQKPDWSTIDGFVHELTLSLNRVRFMHKNHGALPNTCMEVLAAVRATSLLYTVLMQACSSPNALVLALNVVQDSVARLLQSPYVNTASDMRLGIRLRESSSALLIEELALLSHSFDDISKLLTSLSAHCLSTVKELKTAPRSPLEGDSVPFLECLVSAKEKPHLVASNDFGRRLGITTFESRSKLASALCQGHRRSPIGLVCSGDVFGDLDRFHRVFDHVLDRVYPDLSKDASYSYHTTQHALSLGGIHFLCGHTIMATSAIHEALRIAQQRRDQTCVTVARSWLHYLAMTPQGTDCEAYSIREQDLKLSEAASVAFHSFNSHNSFSAARSDLAVNNSMNCTPHRHCCNEDQQFEQSHTCSRDPVVLRRKYLNGSAKSSVKVSVSKFHTSGQTRHYCCTDVLRMCTKHVLWQPLRNMAKLNLSKLSYAHIERPVCTFTRGYWCPQASSTINEWLSSRRSILSVVSRALKFTFFDAAHGTKSTYCEKTNASDLGLKSHRLQRMFQKLVENASHVAYWQCSRERSVSDVQIPPSSNFVRHCARELHLEFASVWHAIGHSGFTSLAMMAAQQVAPLEGCCATRLLPAHDCSEEHHSPERTRCLANRQSIAGLAMSPLVRWWFGTGPLFAAVHFGRDRDAAQNPANNCYAVRLQDSDPAHTLQLSLSKRVSHQCTLNAYAVCFTSHSKAALARTKQPSCNESVLCPTIQKSHDIMSTEVTWDRCKSVVRLPLYLRCLFISEVNAMDTRHVELLLVLAEVSFFLGDAHKAASLFITALPKSQEHGPVQVQRSCRRIYPFITPPATDVILHPRFQCKVAFGLV
mmetsp:Transcript_10362/g.31228  ORF Transcript_10362/g.31228 Transcript_10362/m.31228 type:complete len:860 (+) Transcript_10362:7787-10366(+)